LAILTVKLTNMKLTKKVITLYKNTAKKLKKAEQRKFKAEITNMYLGGDTRKARQVFWWLGKSVELWQHELRTGIESLWFYENCGRMKLEDKFPQLAQDIEDLVKDHISADNKLQSTFQFCKIGAKNICEKLVSEKWYSKDDFKPRGLNNTLNRLWYRLKKT